MPQARRHSLMALVSCIALPILCAPACSATEETDDLVRRPRGSRENSDASASNIAPGGSANPAGTSTNTPPGSTPNPPGSVDGSVPDSSSPPSVIIGHPPGAPGCGLASAAFCDTFDAPAGIGNRSGELNGVLWGVSRLSQNVNLSGPFNAWAPTQLETCTGAKTVTAPNDIIICNGQLRQASNDNPDGIPEGGHLTVVAMYPKQPFDFTGRTGTIVFDVSNDTHGTHGAWPELWVTDRPVPAPFAHDSGLISLPQFGFGIRMANCPPFNAANQVGVDSVVVINNGVRNDTANGGSLAVTNHGCVQRSNGPGHMNHYEVRVSQSQIDVYGTNPGTTTPLKHLATVANPNLGFSRGFIWLQDAHYNADKGELPSQRQHTFSWDNVGFDGPFTFRDLAFDALDNTELNANGSANLGRKANAGQMTTWQVPGLPATPTAEVVRVLFNLYHYDPPSAINVTVNGHAHATPWPFDARGYTWRTVAVTIPITDLVAGNNVVQIGTPNQAIVASNVDIVLANVTQ